MTARTITDSCVPWHQFAAWQHEDIEFLERGTYGCLARRRRRCL